MIKIMVVEDEPPILRAIVAAIKSCGDEYDVAGTAFNGKAATELLRKAQLDGEPFDLVFMDIKMPVMNGLELAEIIYTCHPATHSVMISGYHEFTYVQSALRSHVLDYITKPVSRDILKPILERVGEMVARQKKESIEKHLHKTFTGDGEKQPCGKSEKYAPFLLCAGAFPTVSDTSMMPGRKFWHQYNLESILSDMLLPGEEISCFNGKTESERIAVFNVGSVKRCKELANRLFEYFEDKEPFVTIIYPEALYSLNDIGECLNRMRIRLQNYCRFLHLSILSEYEELRAPAIPENDGKSIIAAMLSGNRQELDNLVRAELSRMVSVEATQNQISHSFKKLISSEASRLGLDAQTVNTYLYDVDFSITNSYSHDSFCESIVFLLSNLMPKNENALCDKHEPTLISEIERYLKEHYREDLTNTQLAQVFNFVPSYISKLFKTYRGLSPSEYLTKYRIQTAIRIMQNNPGTLIKEAAQSVGLHDQYYFSKLFKKETGKCPSDYFGLNTKE